MKDTTRTHLQVFDLFFFLFFGMLGALFPFLLYLFPGFPRLSCVCFVSLLYRCPP